MYVHNIHICEHVRTLVFLSDRSRMFFFSQIFAVQPNKNVMIFCYFVFNSAQIGVCPRKLLQRRFGRFVSTIIKLVDFVIDSASSLMMTEANLPKRRFILEGQNQFPRRIQNKITRHTNTRARARACVLTQIKRCILYRPNTPNGLYTALTHKATLADDSSLY